MKPPVATYMDIKGASAYSSLSVPTLRNHIAAGRLPCFKIGGKIVIKISEFDEWIEHHRMNKRQDLAKITDDILTGINYIN